MKRALGGRGGAPLAALLRRPLPEPETQSKLRRKLKMETRDKRVLILGAGFGGLYTALALEKTVARDAGVRVTVVNRENHSLFTPMLHEVAASDLDMTHIVNPVRKLLKHVRFFNGEVRHIDLSAKRVADSSFVAIV